MILVGDIGGTKTVLALYQYQSGKFEKTQEEVFRSQDFRLFDQVLTRFLENNKDKKIEAVCIGVAGPIKDGRCETTNLPWILDEKELREKLGIKKVKLLNDLEASAYGMLFLPEHELVEINKKASPPPKNNIVVIAAGTGLGEALLIWDGQEYIPVASEGGHTDLAPKTDQEFELLRYLRSKFGHVSYERVLSGPGLFNIYKFLRDTSSIEEPDWLKEKLKTGDPSATISQIGLSQEHELCTKTLHLFVSLYGAEAGNLALKALALGGVYIGGGIAPKILDKLRDGTFMKAFLDKGRYSKLLSDISIKVSLNNRAPLIGAAHYASNLINSI